VSGQDSSTKAETSAGARAQVGPCACTPGQCACDGPGTPVRAEVPLTSLEPGQVGMVTRTMLSEQDASLLRAMGLRPSARIRLCQAGEPWIIEVRRPGGACSRIGLAGAIARGVHVGPAV
jgi:Fe2+ transport system protein FeoA